MGESDQAPAPLLAVQIVSLGVQPRSRVRSRVEWNTRVAYRAAGLDRYAPKAGLVFEHLPGPRLATWGAWLSVDDIEVIE